MREAGAWGVVTRKSVLPLAIAALTTVQVTSLFSRLVETKLVQSKRLPVSQQAQGCGVVARLDWCLVPNEAGKERQAAAAESSSLLTQTLGYMQHDSRGTDWSLSRHRSNIPPIQPELIKPFFLSLSLSLAAVFSLSLSLSLSSRMCVCVCVSASPCSASSLALFSSFSVSLINSCACFFSSPLIQLSSLRSYLFYSFWIFKNNKSFFYLKQYFLQKAECPITFMFQRMEIDSRVSHLFKLSYVFIGGRFYYNNK